MQIFTAPVSTRRVNFHFPVIRIVRIGNGNDGSAGWCEPAPMGKSHYCIGLLFASVMLRVCRVFLINENSMFGTSYVFDARIWNGNYRP